MQRRRQMMNSSKRPNVFRAASRRGGFTLIELFVVVVILSILASMIVVVFGQTGNNARTAGTQTLIKQLDSVLKDRLEGFRRYNFRSEAQQFTFSRGLNPASYPVSTMEVVVRKLRYRGAFPQRVQDLYGFDNQADPTNPSASVNNDNAPLWWAIRNAYPSLDLRPSGDLSGPNGSSELLYLSLTLGESFGAAPLDLDQIDGKYLRDTDNDKVPEFLDGWEKPLRFYNFPTALLRPNGNVPDPTATPPDPGEPLLATDYQLASYLITSLPPLPATAPQRAANNYETPLNIDPYDPIGEIGTLLANPSDFERNYHSINTFYTPLIISGGADEQLGLHEPDATGGTNGINRLCKVLNRSNPDSIYDNLTNQQRGGF